MDNNERGVNVTPQQLANNYGCTMSYIYTFNHCASFLQLRNSSAFWAVVSNKFIPVVQVLDSQPSSASLLACMVLVTYSALAED